MDVAQQLATVRSDVDKLSKKTIDELNKVAADGLGTVQKVAAGVEKVQGKVAAGKVGPPASVWMMRLADKCPPNRS